MNGDALSLRRAVEKHRIVGFDTAPLIYYIEDIGPYAELLEPAFELLGRGRLSAVISTIALAEILAKPLADKNFSLIDEIKFVLKSFSTLMMVSIDEKLAEAAALIRARHGIRLPDALQVAAALHGEATLFITNDKRLRKVDGLEILVVSDYFRR